jgi:hypothetical protein
MARGSIFRCTAARVDCGGMALGALGLFPVEILVSFRKQGFDTLAITAIDGDADAGGEPRRFIIVSHDFTDAVGHAVRFGLLRFRKNEGEFVATIARGGIDGAAVNAENIREAADGAAADEMAVAVVDNFQAIEVEKQDSKRAAGAVGALGFVFEDVEETAVVGEAGERVADGHVANALEEAGVLEKRAAESDGVAHDHEALGENEGSVHQPRRLRGGKLSGDVQPSGGVYGAIKGGILHHQTAAVPEETDQKNPPGQ